MQRKERKIADAERVISENKSLERRMGSALRQGGEKEREAQRTLEEDGRKKSDLERKKLDLKRDMTRIEGEIRTLKPQLARTAALGRLNHEDNIGKRRR